MQSPFVAKRRVQTPLLGGLFGSSGVIEVGEREVRLNGESRPIPFEDIYEASWRDGLIWGDLTLTLASGRAWTATLSKPDGPSVAGHITERTKGALRDALIRCANANRDLAVRLISLLDGTSYVRQSQVGAIRAEASAEVSRLRSHPLADEALWEALPADYRTVLRLVVEKDRLVLQRNERFLAGEVAKYQHFFDVVASRPLTNEQRLAAVVLEDRNLVSAAAGSGKTATLVAKTGYLLLSGAAAAHEILLLAFNNSAAEEIGERLQTALAPLLAGRTVEARTFHSFGLTVIGEATGHKPSVYDASRHGGEMPALAALIDGLFESNAVFQARWLLFRTAFLKEPRDPASFRTVEEWEAFVDTQGRWRKDGARGFLTLNGELVKSQGELAIANWLALNSVPYEYERPYEFQTATREYRQYQPDFYLPDIDTYLEHYALDANGNPPPAFGARYAESMLWKRALHEEKGTEVIETTFAQLVDGSLFDRLQDELSKRGQQVAPADKRVLLAKLKSAQEYDYPAFLQSVVRPFISHAKSNRITPEMLRNGAVQRTGDARESLFCGLMADLIDEYTGQLAERGEVDFDDMIVMAEDEILRGRYRSPFKVILVDEFQDISAARARMVKALLDQRPDATLLGVGDARQSIYRFAGSDVSVFNQFEDVFGYTKRLRLSKTFRFNQGIATVSSEFVGQYDGDVVSDDPTNEAVVHIRLYQERDEAPSVVRQALAAIAREVAERGDRTASVLVLYRVNLTGQRLGRVPDFGGRLAIEAMTIHRSKGLEADYVVVAGVTGVGIGQFPSKIADDRLLQIVLKEKEPDNAEERRLMYVAITRARRRVYIVAAAKNTSEFVEDLIAASTLSRAISVQDAAGEPMERCGHCGRGFVVERRGPYGRFYGCSRYPRCKGKRQIAAVQP